MRALFFLSNSTYNSFAFEEKDISFQLIRWSELNSNHKSFTKYYKTDIIFD
jgi:hypothetical protein